MYKYLILGVFMVAGLSAFAGEYNKKTIEPEVVIYTIEGCPYCIKAKEFLVQKGLKFHQVDISQNRGKWMELKNQTSQNTVPYVFINDKFIGGCSELLALDSDGKLDAIVTESSK